MRSSIARSGVPVVVGVWQQSCHFTWVCKCLLGGASIPDVDVRFESCLPGVPMEPNGIPEDDDQEQNASTDDEDSSAPDWG